MNNDFQNNIIELTKFALQKRRKMEYNFRESEKNWQKYWKDNKTFKAENPTSPSPFLPERESAETQSTSNSSASGRLGGAKYYVLDMFPYPSGAGLHVGHPLGYIASDIVTRYKRLKGFNVLHPMGYDSFGLPAEQYAIQTGQHPAITTEQNIARYREQLDNIGFSFDWDREVRTSDPNYYKWTQWIFMQIFNSWYNKKSDKAEPIDVLIKEFETSGNTNVNAVCDEIPTFSSQDWNAKSEEEKLKTLLNYRLTYLADTWVNWCPQLGTVLANEEIKDGVSERGGYPVERKLMKQWSMRITAYAQRLLDGLDKIDWTESIKESQRNWIGKSEGASIKFQISPNKPLLNPPQKGGLSEHNKFESNDSKQRHGWQSAAGSTWNELKERSRELRNNQTDAEAVIWNFIKGEQLGFKIRRQHVIGNNIVDFVCLQKKIVIEIDGKIHDNQKEYDAARTVELESVGFSVIRFTNDEIFNEPEVVAEKIKVSLEQKVLPFGEDLEGACIEVFTTRPDTIFGVSFLTLAPEHELVNEITTSEYRTAVDEYVTYAKNRSERDRMSEVKKITGQFTGAYAINPFTDELIPIWIGDYVLAGYGTGAVMAVPAGDQRDYDFAKHFNLPILPIVAPSNSPKGEDAVQSNETHDTQSTSNPPLGGGGAANPTKDGIMINSGFLDGLTCYEAMKIAIAEIEKMGIGKGKINYRLRDAIFSRQRYWGEPIPVYFKNDIPYLIDEKDLPLVLPEVDKYLPTETGEPPLARATNWTYKPSPSPSLPKRESAETHETQSTSKILPFGEDLGGALETSTMPGWAGSSWYFLRYMDAHNDKEFVSKEAAKYWNQVDLYLGGSEHATGHLLYCRFWTKFLNDLGFINFDEPAKKLINQGMIQGRSNFVYRSNFEVLIDGLSDESISRKLPFVYISFNLKKLLITNSGDLREEHSILKGKLDSCMMELEFLQEQKIKTLPELKNKKVEVYLSNFTKEINVNVNFVDNDILDLEKFRNWLEEFKNAEFILEDKNGNAILGSATPSPLGRAGEGSVYVCGSEVEKMSKSKWNVVNPDDIVEKYGADCLRLYEMFLGPLELSKPWNTNGITGVSGFLKKYWRMFITDGKFFVSDDAATKQELKVLHKTIKKVEEDIERFSFNTSVSTFMICTNELTDLKCNKREILEPLTILLAPYAPHIAEEVWKNLGHAETISYATFPTFNEKYLVESSFEYPISINGKTKFNLALELSLNKEEVEKVVLENEQTQKYLDGKSIKKVIVVHGKIVNVVV